MAVLPVPVLESQVNSGPGLPCTDNQRKMGGQDLFYFEAVKQIKPPEWKDSLIGITVGGEVKLILWTDGRRFELITDTPKTPQKDIYDYFLDLDRSCRLPPTPEQALKLVGFQWERKDLPASQFASLHRAFDTALGAYAAQMQNRYDSLIKTQMSPSYVDALRYSIIYDNQYEHVEVQAWDVPEHGKSNAILNWVHGLKTLGEDAFHRSFPH